MFLSGPVPESSYLQFVKNSLEVETAKQVTVGINPTRSEAQANF